MNNNNQTEYKMPLGSRLFILFTVCMIVVLMAVPAFALDYPNDFPGMPAAPDGYDTYIIRYGYNGYAEADVYMVVFFNASSDPIYFNGTNLVKKNATSYIQYYYNNGAWSSLAAASTNMASWGNSIIDANFVIYDQNGDVWWSPPPPPPDLGQEVTGVLPTVLSWIQQTVNALFVEGGALQGLLLLVAVPVAITLLFLAARFIRNLIWGA